MNTTTRQRPPVTRTIALTVGIAFLSTSLFAARPIITGPVIVPSAPNVCDTPGTPSPTPTPYPNLANSGSVIKTKRTVKIADSENDCDNQNDDDEDDDSNDGSSDESSED